MPADEMNGSENGKPDSDYTYYIEVAARVNPKLMQLAQQQVPHVTARAVRRNASAMKFFKRSGFQWVRTEEYLLGRDM